MDEPNELQPERKHDGRNLDGTFAPGHKFSVGNSGRPKGLSFKALLRHIAEEVAGGEKTWRELLVDKAFRRAIADGSDPVLIHLLKQLDDEPQRHHHDVGVRYLGGVTEDDLFGPPPEH